MPMPEEIKKQIENFSRQSKQDELFNYLKPILENSGLDPQELYEYAKGCYWLSPITNYVINAESINKLGVVLSTLCPENNCMAAKFFLLAAERGWSWGYDNYASLSLTGTSGVEQSLENALIHAKKAIELTQKTASPHQHKYTYARVLRAHKSYSDAIINAMQYLGFVIQQK